MDERLKERKFSRVLGNSYKRWTVIDDLIYWERGKQRKVLCQCSCPDKTIKLVGLAQLNDKTSGSCGCLQREVIISRNFKHGYSKRKDSDPIYDLWGNMLNRCYNENNKSYDNYGGRGITVCDEWKYNAKLFVDWCLDNGWEESLTIDRKNNDGDYKPSNCRFVTRKINNSNRRRRVSTKTMIRGVYFNNWEGEYYSNVLHNGKRLFQKYGFETPEEAARARDIFIIKNNLPHKLNFPELAINGPL